MKTFKQFVIEASRSDLNTKYQGMPTSALAKIVKDDRKYSPADRAAAQAEIKMRGEVRS